MSNKFRGPTLGLALMVIASCGEGLSREPGAETPRAVLARLSAAIESRDARAVAALIPLERDRAETLGELVLESRRYSESLERAVLKFGETELLEAMRNTLPQSPPMVLRLLHQDFGKLAESGELEVKGEEATVSLRERTRHGVGISFARMVRLEGRWYLSPGGMNMPPRDIADRLVAPLGELADATERAVESSASAAAFAKRFSRVESTFRDSVSGDR